MPKHDTTPKTEMTPPDTARLLAAHVTANGMPPKGTTLFGLYDIAGVDADDAATEDFSRDLWEIANECMSVHITGNEPLDALDQKAFLDLMRAMAGDEPEPTADMRPLRDRIIETMSLRMMGMPIEEALSIITRDLDPVQMQAALEAMPEPTGESRETKMAEPLIVNAIATNGTKAWRGSMLFGGECGDMVSIRPVAKEYGDRTYLGIMLGEIAQSVSVGVRKSDGTLVYDMSWHNPAVFVPDLDTVIFGNASWWGHISSVEDLRQITDADIDGVWYVRALKQIAEREAEDAQNGEG